MKKRVWILNHHANDDFAIGGGRHYYFAKYLKRLGYEPTIFCSNAVHGKNTTYFDNQALWQEHISEEIDIPFVFIKGTPYANNGKARVRCMCDYYRNVVKAAGQYAEEKGKPDVIYASSVHPLALAAGIKIAKKFKVKCICEVRDLWPESFVAYGLIPANHPVTKMLYKGEKWLYKKADRLIFTMAGGAKYIADKGWDKQSGGPIDLSKVYHINNGVDLELFDYNKNNFICEDEELSDDKVFKLVYCGSLRKVNDLQPLMDAARAIKNKGYSDIKLLVYGDGDRKQTYEEFCTENGLDNVIFKGKVNRKFIPNILSRGDVCIVDGGKDDGIGRYGMSQNKTFDYLASGKPIINPRPSSYDIIKEHDCGITIENNSEEIESWILKLHDSPELCKQLGNKARQVGEEYDFSNLARKLSNIIEAI